MKKSMNIKLCLKIILFMPIVVGLLTDIVSGSDSLMYLIDLLNLLLLVFYLKNNNFKIHIISKDEKQLLGCFGLLFVLSLFSTIMGGQSLLLYVWGVRNSFRFFVFFWGCISFFDIEDVKRMLEAFRKLFWYHVGLMLFQFLILKYRGDRLGGLWGINLNAGAYINIYLCFIVAWVLINYLYKRENLFSMIIIMGSCIIITALTETKVFFLELIIIVALLLLDKNLNYRKIVIVGVGVVCFVAGALLLICVFPEWVRFSSIGAIIHEYKDIGYTYSGDINRLNFISKCNELFYHNYQMFIGLGIGNCDYSERFAFFQSPFYLQYGELHYRWFASAMYYLETGIIGLSLYIILHVLMTKAAVKIMPKAGVYKKEVLLAKVFGVLSLLLIFYSTCMKIESAYFVYFILSIPYIVRKTQAREIDGVS